MNDGDLEVALMHKRLILAALLAGASLPALAQANVFLERAPEGSMRASTLIGVPVIGADIARLGEVEDVIVGRDGRAQAVLVEVGGFLGLGGKSVAVPLEAMLWNFDARPTDGPGSSNTGANLQLQGAAANDPASPSANTTGSVASGGGAAGVDPGPLTAMARGSGDSTQGRTGMEAAMGGPAPTDLATVAVTDGGAPASAVLRMTRAELRQAPAFR